MLNSFLSQLLFGSNVEATSSAINEGESTTTTTTIKTNSFIDRNTDIDWVIVDPDVQNDEKKLQDLKRSLNLARSLNEYGLQDLFSSTMQCSKKFETDDLNSDGGDDGTLSNDTTQSGEMVHQQAETQDAVMIGPQPQPKDTWLITPLPSLVSLNTSQRSIVDCGALENLLIEHPSMSVFVSVGEDEDDEEVVADVYENDGQIEMEQEKKPVQFSPKAPTPKKRKNRNRKNKASNTSVIRTAVTNALQQQAVVQDQQQQQASIAKPRVLCNFLHSQQQVKKNNKLQNTIHFHNNVKQRKYHNLQQPKFVKVC